MTPPSSPVLGQAFTRTGGSRGVALTASHALQYVCSQCADVDSGHAQRLNSTIVRLIDNAEQEVPRGDVAVLEPLRRPQRYLQCVPGMASQWQLIVDVMRARLLRPCPIGGRTSRRCAFIVRLDLPAQILGINPRGSERVRSVTRPGEQAK